MYESNVDLVVHQIWQSFLKGVGQRPDKRVLLGVAEIVLLKWNWPFYSDQPQLVGRIENDLEDAYNSTAQTLDVLQGVRLGSPSFANHLDEIGEVYDLWQSKAAIRMVGASKALHFINPELFVPWDTAIRTHYHDETKHGQHSPGSKECYKEFMKTCNDIAMALLNSVTIDELYKRHPAYISRREVRTLPKMIDECNYCWITRRERW